MKSKKLLICALVLFSLGAVNCVMAQSPTNTDNVTLNINLSPIQAIVVNTTQTTVNLDYEDIADYESGVTTGALSEHLSVYSAGPFVVKVGVAGDVSDGTGSIPAGNVTIIPTLSSGTPTATLTSSALSTTAATIISATAGGNGLKYDIEYDNQDAGDDFAYTSKYTKTDGSTQTYTATVTYTISPS